MTALLTLVATTMPAQAAPVPTTPTAPTPPSGTAPAYLHGFQQPQQLCPGGQLVGKVSDAIVDPTVAVAGGRGECTLADMKAANPGTTFYAYMNLGAMSERSPENGAFQRTCADPSSDGRKFGVIPRNSRVATNSMGMATYPGWNYSTISNLSNGYADACATAAAKLLQAPSLPGRVTKARPAKFDGVFFDDVAMTAGHGQDMDYVGKWGPWADDNAYARRATAVVDSVNRQLDNRLKRDVPLAVNLGIYPEKPSNVARANELARTGAVDFAMREFSTQDRNGSPLSTAYLRKSADVNRQLTAAGMPILNHDYAVSKRAVGAAGYGQGKAINGGAQCLKAGNTAVARAADTRRERDYRMLLGQTLLTRDSGARGVKAVIPQVENCQDQIARNTGLAESVTDRSVNPNAAGVRELRDAVNNGVYGTGARSTSNQVLVRKLSNNRYVLVNPTNTHRSVSLNGKSWSVPGRSAALAG